MSNMILRCFAIYSLRLILLANVAFASQPQWSVLSWLSSSVYTLIVFPSNTQQWSLLGLNLWPGQTIEKPSDGFDLSENPISRGKFSECRFVFLLRPLRRSWTNATSRVCTGICVSSNPTPPTELVFFSFFLGRDGILSWCTVTEHSFLKITNKTNEPVNDRVTRISLFLSFSLSFFMDSLYYLRYNPLFVTFKLQ